MINIMITKRYLDVNGTSQVILSSLRSMCVELPGSEPANPYACLKNEFGISGLKVGWISKLLAVYNLLDTGLNRRLHAAKTGA
jgi:hypothetical protein